MNSTLKSARLRGIRLRKEGVTVYVSMSQSTYKRLRGYSAFYGNTLCVKITFCVDSLRHIIFTSTQSATDVEREIHVNIYIYARFYISTKIHLRGKKSIYVGRSKSKNEPLR